MVKTKQTVVINGRKYDAATGLAMQAVSPKTVPAADVSMTKQPSENKTKKPSTQIRIISDIAPPPRTKQQPHNVTRAARQAAAHRQSTTQKSTTLRRSGLKKPITTSRPAAQKMHRKVERSKFISRFGSTAASTPAHHKKNETPQPQADTKLAQEASDLEQTHIIRLKRQAETHVKPVISSRAVKEHLLKQSLVKANTPEFSPHATKHRSAPKTRFASIAATSMALILLAGYVTYINIPNLSIRVAAANAGVEASLPRYQPDGYRINGPIAYAEGEVVVTYQQDNEDRYSLIQTNSDWDPQATLANYVQPKAGDDYQIHSVQGLTVYTFDDKAAWVNGGILHVIDSSRPLSGQDIDRIAVSM